MYVSYNEALNNGKRFYENFIFNAPIVIILDRQRCV